jgi:hypothetical protein
MRFHTINPITIKLWEVVEYGYAKVSGSFYPSSMAHEALKWALKLFQK